MELGKKGQVTLNKVGKKEYVFLKGKDIEGGGRVKALYCMCRYNIVWSILRH